MAPVRTFRDLIAWQRAMSLAELLYREARQMPPEEKYELTGQMKRAAVSVPSNIAEGFGRQSRPDFRKFLRVARGSLNELMTQYELALRLGMLQPGEQVLDLMAETDRVLQGLINSLRE
jgi:four helix bundle protein